MTDPPNLPCACVPRVPLKTPKKATTTTRGRRELVGARFAGDLQPGELFREAHAERAADTGKIKLKPVLMQKGNTRVALYGLGYIRDARLHQMFSVKGNVEWARPENTEAAPWTSWFNMMLIHQEPRLAHAEERHKRAVPAFVAPTWWSWGTSTSAWWSPRTSGTSTSRSPGRPWRRRSSRARRSRRKSCCSR